MYYTGLRERTSYFKETEEGKSRMSDVFERLYENGRTEGIAEGRAEGIAEGIAKGRAEGLAEGLAEGRAEGIEDGIRKGAMNTARSMIRDGSIPLAKVAEFSGLSLDEVEKLKNGISL